MFTVRPKAAKRVNTAVIEATLVLVKDRASIDSDARLPALRPFESGVVDFVNALPDSQRDKLQRLLRLGEPPAEDTDAPMSEGAAAAAAVSPSAADLPSNQIVDTTDDAAVPSVTVKQEGQPALDKPRQEHADEQPELEEEPTEEDQDGESMATDDLVQSIWLYRCIHILHAHLPYVLLTGAGASETRRYAPFLLVFSDDGLSFRIETDAESDGSLSACPLPLPPFLCCSVSVCLTVYDGG